VIRRIASILLMFAALVAAGCTTLPGDEAATMSRPTETSEGRRWLERGIEQFEQGRFADAIRLLQESPEIAADAPEVRAEALKYIAFAQCVSGRRIACRRTFDALLLLDPGYALNAAEAGHPAWGPEFERARAARPTAAPAQRAAS